MKHISGVLLLGRLQTLRTKLRLGWKGLSEKSTPAYYKHMYITVGKNYITLGLVVSLRQAFKATRHSA